MKVNTVSEVNMQDYAYVKDNYLCLLNEIASLSNKNNNQPVTLVAVTKSGSDGEVCALAEAGAKDFGENRPQMLKARNELLTAQDFTPRMHEIGNLQKNKVKMIIDNVALIHSLDSIELAIEIDKQAKKVSRTVPVLIEVNSAREANKGGVMPEDVESFFLRLKNFDNISVQGLMTMGPVCENPEDIRVYFKNTKNIFDEIKNKHGYDGEGILSMGMSDSYKIAIEEGATLVRVGRRLFKNKEGDN
jgi:pyridoxal phosphate enzyme (YggS family)